MGARVNRWSAFVLALAAIPILVGWVLPALAESGYAGEVIQRNYREGRDATPLFYTESEETMELIRQLRHEHRDR